MIVATAGHVDHGKTALVAALTGTDTDRLPEEKARGLSIDLGFAYADMPEPDGGRLGFVDMPGHERFLSNLIAGLAVIDTVLLVVAADSGPEAQTLAQLRILALLEQAPGAVVLSKVDRADAGRRAAAAAEAVAAVQEAGFDAMPVLPFSAVTGEGQAELLHWLQEAASAHVRPRPGARFRMPLDRAFTGRGTGLVVTGGVGAGALAEGAAAMLSPAGLEVRARGIHAMGRPAGAARAGQRCAVNLAGRGLAPALAGRGQWLLDPALHRPTARLDVRLRPAPGMEAALRGGRQVAVHLAATRLQARLALHDPVAGEESVLAHLRLDRPAAALAGDRLLLRDPGSGAVLAGGRILEPWPPERGMMRRARGPLLAALALPAGPARAAALLAASPGGVDLARHALQQNLSTEAAAAEFAAEFAADFTAAGALEPVPGLALGAPHWAALQAALEAAVAAAHEAAPEAAGPGRAALLRPLARRLPVPLAAAALDALLRDGRLVGHGEHLALPGHVPRLRPEDAALWARLAPLLAEAPPPTMPVLARRLGIPPGGLERALGRLAVFGHVVFIARNRVVAADALAGWRALLPGLGGGQPFTVRAFCDAAGLGRNFAVALLEHFDRIGATRREGEEGRLPAGDPPRTRPAPGPSTPGQGGDCAAAGGG